MREHSALDRQRLRKVVTLLWQQPVFERRLAAVVLLESSRQLLEPGDVSFLERLLIDSKTWALVDQLAIAVVGSIIERNPSAAAVLDA